MDYWLTQAKMLRFGQHRKIQCCSNDQSMRIEHNAQGYRGWCFRCKEPHFEAHGVLSLAELKQRSLDLDALVYSKEISLPTDLTAEMPGYAAAWLLRAGIPLRVAAHYNIRYSPKLDRVVLPVYRNGILASYTMRSVKEKPKYIERQVDEAVVFVSDNALILNEGQRADHGFDLVITEDILSAIRVGRIVPTVALLGTSVSTSKVLSALDVCAGRHSKAMAGTGFQDTGLCIGIWLDADKAGRTAARRLARRLELLGHSALRIRTDKDPKRYSNREIRSILNDRRYSTEANEPEEGLRSAEPDAIGEVS